jgi:ADP-heptose:LPS heptosyltransferase
MEISIILSNNKLFSNLVKLNIFLIVKFFRTINKILHLSHGNQIVVIAFHKLGDSVFTLPALKEIHKFSNGNFIIFCFEETRPIFELFYDKRYIISFNHSDFSFSGRVTRRIVRKKLKKINPKVIFDLTGGSSTATLLFNSPAKEIIGITEEYYKPMYTKYSPVRKKPHIMDIYFDAIKPAIPVFDENLKKFNSNINKDGFILIQPFAGWKAKEWGLKKFIDLSEKINKNYKSIIVTESGRINEEVKNEINHRGIEIIETRDIYELIKVTKNCSLFISNDAGPIYIANMLGKPTLTIYGPTNPAFHLPYGNKHKFIQKIIKCSPLPEEKSCFTDAGRNGCPSFECMHLLNVDEVYNELELFINELGIEKEPEDI